jgi:hypothetical protein
MRIATFASPFNLHRQGVHLAAQSLSCRAPRRRAKLRPVESAREDRGANRGLLGRDAESKRESLCHDNFRLIGFCESYRAQRNGCRRRGIFKDRSRGLSGRQLSAQHRIVGRPVVFALAAPRSNTRDAEVARETPTQPVVLPARDDLAVCDVHRCNEMPTGLASTAPPVRG